MSITLDPGQSVTVPVILTWCFPNRYVQLPDVDEPRWVGNHYSQRFRSADAAARYVVAERERLEAGDTRIPPASLRHNRAGPCDRRP